MEFQFKKYQPAALRLWHWMNALTIFGLLGTVLLRKTFLSWRGNAALIEQQATALGAQGLTADAAATIAKAIRDPMWDWHYTLGFVLAGLVLSRLGLGLLKPELAPLRSALRDLKKFFALPATQKKGAAHYVLVKAGYAVFYVAVFAMTVSGLVLYFQKDLGVGKDLGGAVKEAHELAMWFFVVFVAGHLGGVVVSELRGEPGLVSDMINGGAPPPH